MASGSSIVLHRGTYSDLRMDWSSSPNTSTNQSSFSATIYVQITKSGWNIGPWNDVSGSYFGTSSGHTFNGAIPNISGRHNLKTFTTTVNHASDGKGSIRLVWKWGVNSSWGGVVNPSGAYTCTLDNIPRASSVSATGSVAVGSNMGITISRASSSFTHKLEYSFAGLNNQAIASNVGTSYTWTVPKSLANRIPNSTANGISIRCKTYNGGTHIGDKTVGATITIPDTDEFRPTLSMAVSAYNPPLPPGAPTYIQGKTKVKVALTSAGAYSSTIKAHNIRVNGETSGSQSYTTAAVLSMSGNHTINASTTDSRNRSKSVSSTINITPYLNPNIAKVDVYRCNASGAADDQGAYVNCVVSASVSTLNNKNTASFQVVYEPTDGSAAAKTYTISNTVYSLTNKSSVISGFDINKAYKITIKASDWFTSTSVVKSIPTAFALMDFKSNGRGIGIGQVSINDGLHVGMPMYINGINIIDMLKAHANRNYIVNSDFEIWARYSSGNCTLNLNSRSQYFADRWCVRGNGSFYFGRESNRYVRFVSNSDAGNTWMRMSQHIYIGQRTFKDKPLTFSFVINTDQAITFQTVIRENHSSNAKEVARFEFTTKAGQDTFCTGTIPKVILPSDDNHLDFCVFQHGDFRKSMGAVRIHSVKVEHGTTPTMYEKDSYEENKVKCMAAYQVIGTTTVAMSEQVSYFEGLVAVIDCVHPVRMQSLGVYKKAHSVETADLKLHQGGLLADKSKLSFGEYVSDGLYYGIRWTNISGGVNSTSRRPQYANIVGLRLEAEIYSE